ncbi:PepSY-associated TM helix domain-containing protein [Culturomica massiliensis]|uniref:PepSY-associated TM helix domain-containing protein n=1 Tax=Culturomica massiliensis TaxID=1841857 RepID=UPI000838AF47|nr:PepSY-associated TM helix domain-containing protein [Culturomica massiliensis]
MDKEITSRLRIGNLFRQYCRTVHFHLSFFFMGVILIYAVSGITMNHLKDFNPKYDITVNNYTVKGTFPTSHKFNKNEIIQLLKEVGEQDNYIKHFYPNNSTVKVFLKSGSSYILDTQTGNVAYEGIKKRPVFYQLSFLHYNPGTWWTYFSDLFAVCLILICISGILMNKGKRGLFGIGGIELLAGILIPVLALIL